MALRPVSRSYAGRQLDIELLDHVDDTSPSHSVVADVHTHPRIVAGIEKAVQRYAKLFLTEIGSVMLAPDVGGTVLSEIGLGRVQTTTYLGHLCAVADISALEAMSADDSDDRFGPTPDDERVVSTTIDDVELDRTNGRVRVKVTLSTAAGEGFTFIVPVSTGTSA